MAEFYAALGEGVGLEDIITAEDMNEVIQALSRELQRRGKVCTAAEVEAEDVAEGELRDAVRSDLENLNYDGANNPARVKMTAAEIKDYISYLQTLYGINLAK